MRKSLLVLSLVGALVAAGFVAFAQKPAPAAALPFSPARRAGPTLYVSGQVARTPDGQVVRESVEAETRQVMENVGKILKDNGYTFEEVVNATVYLDDINDYATVNKVYATYFPHGFPARACIGGVSLVSGFKVEVSCVAFKNGN